MLPQKKDTRFFMAWWQNLSELKANLKSGATNPKTMGFWEHIDELRGRLMRCVWVFAGGFAVAYALALEPVLVILRKPLFAALPADQQKLYFTSLFENFFTHLKVSGYLAIAGLMPYFLYELWQFVAPGLLEKERKWIFPFLLAGTFFFLLGASFAYWVIFPLGFKYFVTFGTSVDVPLLTIDSYYSLCMKLLLLFGLAFEFPVVLVLLGLLGLFDVDVLRKNRRVAIIGISVVSAVFAPPDAMSMILLAVPLVILYELAILTLVLVKRKSQEASQVPAIIGGEPGAPAVNDPWRGESTP